MRRSCGSFELIIARYGLAAVAFGAGFEGETAVMAGGVLARQGLLPLAGVACAAGIGSFLADQGFFLIGRHFRDRAYVRRALAKPTAHRAIALLERHPNGFILAIRFLYGIRTLSPIAVGASDISRFRFMALNALAAAVWAVLFSTIGYKIGDELHGLFNKIHPYTHVLLIAVAIIFSLLIVLRLICRHLHLRAASRNGKNGAPTLRVE
jgi:membrane protein DedA with SNARE-associated domain